MLLMVVIFPGGTIVGSDNTSVPDAQQASTFFVEGDAGEVANGGDQESKSNSQPANLISKAEQTKAAGMGKEGLHALEAVPVAKGGRGKKGGLSEYAEKVGRVKSKITEYRQAGEVVVNCSLEGTVFLGKAQHLAAIHKQDRPVGSS